jgi:ribosomal protein S27AE
MTVQASRVGAVTFPPPNPRGIRNQQPCPRCGVVRQVNTGDVRRVCGSCADVLKTLDEEEVWEP